MGTFKISVDRFSWICGPEDDPDDRCLHGHVAVQIGENVMEGDGTVSATALYLLKSLKEDKRMSPHSIQMVPCCGFFLLPMRNCQKYPLTDVITEWTGPWCMRMPASG